MKVLDLFSGIGGFSLGLERAGMQTVAFCEIEEYPRKVLAKHWPDVPIYDDVRTLTRERLESDGITGIDVICGGFPCQDISLAGKGAGLAGERSGLWSEFARLIGEIRPRYAIVENTAALLGRGLGDVLGDLAALGYDTDWNCIPACAVGAEHIRDRVWIVAHADSAWKLQPKGRVENQRRRNRVRVARNDPADTVPQRLQGGGVTVANKRNAPGFSERLGLAMGAATAFPREHWKHQPLLGRGVYGIPNRMDRVGCLGNAVVPQIPEIIGRALMEAA